MSPVKWHYEDAVTPHYDTTPDEPNGHELTGDSILNLVLHFDLQEVEELDRARVWNSLIIQFEWIFQDMRAHTLNNSMK